MTPAADNKLACNPELLDSLPFSIFVVDDESSKIIYSNRKFAGLYPNWQNSFCYQIVNDLKKPCYNCSRNELFNQDGRPNGIVKEFEVYNESDERWYHIHEMGIYWGDGRPAAFKVATDITDIKEIQNKLAEAHAELILKHKELELLASTDSLTQVYNRDKLGRIFNKEMRHVQNGEAPFSIISVDIDYFKKVNDTFGHTAGDNVLIAVARCMKNNLRSTDYLGRWGGEEFLILCPETPLDTAISLAERIRRSVAEQEYSTGQQHTVSVGVATYRPGDTLDKLLNRADIALYRAKGTGRNKVCAEEEYV